MVFVMSGQTWATVTIQDADLPSLTYKFSGRQIEPIISGLAVVPIAGILGLIAARGLIQRIIGLAIALSGVGITYLAIAVQSKKTSYVENLLASKLGRDGISHLTTFNPVSQALVAPAIGVAIVGFIFTVRKFDSAKKRANYDTVGVGGVATLTPWQALDAGQDPTIFDPSISDASFNSPINMGDSGSVGGSGV